LSYYRFFLNIFPVIFNAMFQQFCEGDLRDAGNFEFYFWKFSQNFPGLEN
jgi:hypothetical protein